MYDILKSRFIYSLFVPPLMGLMAFLFGQTEMLGMGIAVMWPTTYLILVADKLWDSVMEVDLQLY